MKFGRIQERLCLKILHNLFVNIILIWTRYPLKKSISNNNELRPFKDCADFNFKPVTLNFFYKIFKIF